MRMMMMMMRMMMMMMMMMMMIIIIIIIINKALIFRCKRLKNEREIPKNHVLKVGNWPVSKSELTNRNLKQFIRYISSMDLGKINHSNEHM